LDGKPGYSRRRRRRRRRRIRRRRSTGRRGDKGKKWPGRR